MQKKTYTGLSDEERCTIEILLGRGCSQREIARALGRSPNTISREIRVNSVVAEGTVTPAYGAQKAKQKSRVSRRSRRYQWQKIEEYPQLRAFIIDKLKLDWSPNEIAGYLKVHPELGCCISNRQLYAWLYSSRGQPYCQYLYSARYHPRKRPTKRTERVMIPGRTSITERPVAAADRLESGHYEYDSIVSSKRSGSTAALAVLQERSSRLVSAQLVPNLKPEPYAQCIIKQLAAKQAVSFTTDNGIENKQHQLITGATKAIVYFTDPYSSWQKGGVENANKMIRRYFPKGTDFSTITQVQVDQAISRINNKPRHCLGYKSALQYAVEKGVI